MPDVLGNEPHGPPRWVLAVGVVAVAAMVTALALRTEDAGPSSAAPSPSPTAAGFDAGRAGNACGGDVALPVVDALDKPTGTHLRLLVGDRDLRLVDVDEGWAKVLAPPSPPRAVTLLARNGRDIVAVMRDPCAAQAFGTGQVGIVDPDTGTVTPKGRGDDILPGLPMTVAEFDPAGGVVMRQLDGTRLITLPPGWRPWARTAGGYFAEVLNNGFDSGVPPTVGIGTTASAELSQSFGDGTVVGASSQRLFWMASCSPGPCLLSWQAPGDDASTAQAIGGAGWGGIVSPDGNRLAFRLPRSSGRFGQHPGPPNDVAVVDIRTGRVQVLPGLVVAAKAGLTLAWSPDSAWLAIGGDLGTGHLLLLWRDGMKQLARVPLSDTGGGTTGPPALAFVDQSR
jgi:hypothetical protein